MFISSAYAQTAAAGDMQSSLMSMLPLVLMFVVLYFVMIRPQTVSYTHLTLPTNREV